jgi:hypothetical protein
MSDPAAIADQSYAAAAEEAEARDWGTSREDVNAYASAAGTAAGAAACSAVGAAAAAPLCGYIGGEVAGWISDTVQGWFTDDEEAEAARRRRAEVRAHFASMQVANELDRMNGQAFEALLEQLIALYSELFPGERWEGLDPDHPQARYMRAMLLMQQAGAPVVSRPGANFTAIGVESVRRYWAELDELGIADATKTTRVTERATEIYDALQRAYTACVLQLTTQRAAQFAAAEAEASQGAKDRIQARFAARYTGAAPLPDTSRYAPRSVKERDAHAETRSDPYVPPRERAWWKAGAISGGAVVAAAAFSWWRRLANA